MRGLDWIGFGALLLVACSGDLEPLEPVHPLVSEFLTELDMRGISTTRSRIGTTGEACLGDIDGVISTRAGWLDGHEVVEVNFDPNRLPYRKLVETVAQRECATIVYAHDDKQKRTASRLVPQSVKRASARGAPHAARSR